jgi:hypothetical protein
VHVCLVLVTGDERVTGFRSLRYVLLAATTDFQWLLIAEQTSRNLQYSTGLGPGVDAMTDVRIQ